MSKQSKKEAKAKVKAEKAQVEAEAKAIKKIKEEPEAPKPGQPGHIVINKTDNKDARWYSVHTYSGHEVKVAEQLRQRVEAMGLEGEIFELLIPTQEKIEVHSGQKRRVKEKIFPGYLLVKMILSDRSWLAVRTTNGVTGFIGISGKPTPLDNKEVEAIQKFMAMAAPKFRAKFSNGEAVRIVDGPFEDFLATVENIDDEKGKVRVLVSIFGRETPVELDFSQVTKI